MYEASLYEVVKVILIILLIYFGFKLLIRFLGPLLLRYFLKKIGKKFGEGFNGFDPNMNRQQKEQVKFDRKGRPKRSKKDVGEYIDYEEID